MWQCYRRRREPDNRVQCWQRGDRRRPGVGSVGSRGGRRLKQKCSVLGLAAGGASCQISAPIFKSPFKGPPQELRKGRGGREGRVEGGEGEGERVFFSLHLTPNRALRGSSPPSSFPPFLRPSSLSLNPFKSFISFFSSSFFSFFSFPQVLVNFLPSSSS